MRTSFHHQSEAQSPNGPLTAATSPDTPSFSAFASGPAWPRRRRLVLLRRRRRLRKEFVTIDFPGTDTTWLNGINDSGQMAGAYFEPVAQVFRGFLTDGKNFTTVNYPNL